MNGIGTTPSIAGQNLPGMSMNPSELSGKDIEHVASEFEGVFVSMLLKEMRNTLSEDGGFFGEESSDSYGSMFDTFMGKHIANSSPLGIAELMMRGYENSSGTKRELETTEPSVSVEA